mgnify:CR=1 FL=1
MTTPLPETEYIGSPSIAILPDGSYVAAHDFFGRSGGELGSSRVFGSRDRGATWTPLARLPATTWGSLFVHRGALYLQAIGPEYGDVMLPFKGQASKDTLTSSHVYFDRLEYYEE